MEDLFEYNPTKLVEELRKERENQEEEELDIYSDVLDQIDEFAIKVESLRLHISKKKKKRTSSKDQKSVLRRLYSKERRREKGNKTENQVKYFILVRCFLNA